MRLAVNGEDKQIEDGASLEKLLCECGARAERVAVLVNGRVVPARDRAGWKLRESDRIEILMFAGGG